MSRFRTAAKYFTLGLVVGLLFAPHSGDETRREIRSRIPGVGDG